MNERKKEIDDLIQKLDTMIKKDESKTEIEKIIDELSQLLEEYLK